MTRVPDPTRLEIGVGEARTWLESETPPILIDCREEDEFAICHLRDAELMPLSRWPEALTSAVTDVGQPLLIYCHHGMRSLRAAEHLRSVGYTAAYSLAGGIDAWSREIDRSVPRY